MHCPSCEKLLEGEFKNIPGVRDVRVDRKTDSSEIFFEEAEPDFAALKNTAERFGYTVSERKPENIAQEKKKSAWQEWPASKALRSSAGWPTAAAIVLAILFLYRFFLNAGLVRGVGASGAPMTYGVSILIGLVASVSSCLAVVGAVVIAFSEKYQSGARRFFEGAVRPNLFFHTGRLAAFFILGGLLGAIGGELNISGNFVSIYTIIIAAVMAWLGLNILGWVPSLSSAGVKMPKKFSSRWEELKRSEHKAAPFLLGGLTFFLPCGFTQSMQIFALASGSFLVGGLSLFFFALGTLPSLLVLGITASWTKNRGFAVFQKVAGVLVILFSIFTLNSGLALKGVKTNVISSRNSAQTDASQASGQPSAEGAQTVRMNVTSGGFEPSVFNVKQGVPVKWVINGQNVSGCTSTIIVPSYGISKNLKSEENIIQFTPENKGVIGFSCGMGMVRGKFVVE